MAIKITEISPIKVSGLSSLKVEFDYNQTIVDAIKTLEFAVYHKRLKCWEVPITSLAELVDNLTYYDDIGLQLLDERNLPDLKLPKLTEEEISRFKVRPYKHQIEGINFGLEHPKFLLLDAPGIGKTNEIIWLAETLKNRGLINHCLIVCGIDSLRQNWKKEINKFSNESCVVVGEKISKKGNVSYTTITDRCKQLLEPIDEFFIIVNIATLRSDQFIEAFKKSSNTIGLIAVDEVHRALGNKSSQQASNLLKLDSDFKIAATGSLLVNSPISAYGSLSFTDIDKATLTNFKAQYCNFGGFNNSQVLSYKNLDLLKEEIDTYGIRRTFDMIGDMPPKTIRYELVEMSEEHRKFYDAIVKGVKEEADKIDLKANNLLALTTRLRQATACPSVLTSNSVDSSKVLRCVELVEDLVEQGEKVVIMSTFKEPVYQLGRLLEKYNPLINTGDQKESVIEANKDKFQADPNIKVWISSIARCGTGITLNAARYMIMLDTPWTYSETDQTINRIYRITSDRPVFITILSCKDTIDERVAEIVENKKDLSDYMLDDVENGLAKEMKDIISKL